MAASATPLTQVLTFACGALTGITFTSRIRELFVEEEQLASQPSQEGIVSKPSKSSMTAEDAERRLQDEGKIRLNLSPADNAANILETVLESELNDTSRAAILYAIKILKSDLTNATVPVALERKDTMKGDAKALAERAAAAPTSDTDDENQDVVMDWLKSSFTQSMKTVPKKHQTFKSVAQKVKIALKFKNSKQYESHAPRAFVYDVEPQEMEAIQACLNGVDEWEWDVWSLHAVTKGRPLQTLGWHLLHKWDLVSALKLDESVLRRWLVFVESMYKDTQYHSAVHATDVLQAVHYFLTKGGAADYFNTLRIFALLITAMIHDAGHDGRNNDFHEKSSSERAVMFNDQSIQENYHCMSIFSRMCNKEADMNLFEALERDQAREVRRLIVLITLATDMKSHFKAFHAFKNHAAARGSNVDSWAEDGEAGDELCAALLHAADLSNPCRPFPTARQWAKRVLEEFFAQGEEEERLGLPVSPLCSRSSTPVAKSQVGFIGFVVLPYFQMLEQVFPKLSTVRSLLEANLKQWKDLEAEEAPKHAIAAPAPAAAAPTAAANGGKKKD